MSSISKAWKFFHKSSGLHTTPAGKETNYHYAICKACAQNASERGDVEPPVIIGHFDALNPHIKSCRHISSDDRDEYISQTLSRIQDANYSTASTAFSSKKASSAGESICTTADVICEKYRIDRATFNAIYDEVVSREVTQNDIRKKRKADKSGLNGWVLPGLSQTEVHKLHERLLVLIADAALPFAIVERQSFVDVLDVLRPNPRGYTPNRRQLSGVILNKLSQEANDASLSLLKSLTMRHAFATLIADGWKTVNNIHILGSSLVVVGSSAIYENSQEGSDHHGIAQANALETLINKAMDDPNVRLCAVCTDDCPQVARGRRIAALRFPTLIFLLCWAHQTVRQL